MWKVAGVIVLFLLGFLAGASGMKWELENKIDREEVNEQIVLVIPRNKADINKQLLYYEASMGMLRELQRQMK